MAAHLCAQVCSLPSASFAAVAKQRDCCPFLGGSMTNISFWQRAVATPGFSEKGSDVSATGKGRTSYWLLGINCTSVLEKRIGAAAVQGTGRPIMEDTYSVVVGPKGADPSFFGVFDGHGGIAVAEIAPIKAVWNQRWNWFHRPIHAVAHMLHPIWRDEDQFENEELEEGFMEYMKRLTGNDVAMMQRLEDDLLTFRNQSLSFGRETAKLRETQLKPVSWWEKYGHCAPTLKRIALRVLSQDCSSGPCERNWSTWALFHTKKRNQLTTAQLERLVFCHCNLQLLERNVEYPEPAQVNVDKIDIEKVKDIPTIPPEERDVYNMLYEEMTSLTRTTRLSTRLRRGTERASGASTSAQAARPLPESDTSSSDFSSHESQESGERDGFDS